MTEKICDYCEQTIPEGIECIENGELCFCDIDCEHENLKKFPFMGDD